MRNYPRASLSILLLALALPLAATICLGGLKTERERLRKADCIFVGRVVDFADPIPSAGEKAYAIVFEVERAWKGVQSQKITISSPNPLQCGVFFDNGARYLVFARHGLTDLSWCNKKLPDSAADATIAKLGDPTYEVLPKK